ncbi:MULTISPECIES: type IV secretory system conjugative DNA transfer family protein [unclassified Ruminococcus]|uniref:type IV secretory system conjugative DNA transfer family protein n=1 Tax=unclassified Ruminococcus TaxID=2608920 RepID=UPI002108A46F|nr:MULTISPECIES: type IV secretory system conjugative DNA transfer family protein [unclassified Ruminococcus]MCQ4022392.1 TraM recognition domain-containing protein [Ruminococcus sp. zg-924]MCQ4114720.1 TraM recognition domain-containing protein [Ruminococcus sp. zg-921]
MTGNITLLIVVGAIMFAVLGGVTLLAHIYSLNNIKSRTVGDGQHGTARWATKREIRKTYRHIPFTPEQWREQAKNGKAPTTAEGEPLPQGIVVGCTGNTTAMVDTGDVHALMIGAAGVGKTAYWLYPCIEYACASGMSWLSTDTKGDIMRNYGQIAKDYGYHVSVIDLRNPTRSNGNNLLHLVNKYMDLYQANPDKLVYKARCEKYAKIISKTIILSGMDAASFGQNAYFYDAAEGLLTATILLVAEFCRPEQRHIVSVFKIIQELLAPSGKKGKNQFQQLMEMLPNDHKAKWFAGAALNTAEQSMASVMSTALSRLNAFLDSELEQILCFDTEIDAEKFCKEKSALFIIMPEENPATFFMISLIIQQLYREILAVADENGGKLKNRCVFFCDEYGTLPKIESAEMMFSASRSRRLQIVPIIQSFSQLEKNYGKEGAEIIVDNTQLTIFGGFAPQSSSAETLSKALGSRTVMSGSVSRSKNDPSESLQMIERPLMTPDELKSMPKGQFVVMKTGFYPMKVKLKLFFKWGIQFDEKHPYEIPDQGNRKVEYAAKKDILDGIVKKYHPELLEPLAPPEESGVSGGQDQQIAEKNDPKSARPQDKEKRRSGGVPVQTAPRSRRSHQPVTTQEQEVKSDGQA